MSYDPHIVLVSTKFVLYRIDCICMIGSQCMKVLLNLISLLIFFVPVQFCCTRIPLYDVFLILFICMTGTLRDTYTVMSGTQRDVFYQNTSLIGSMLLIMILALSGVVKFVSDLFATYAVLLMLAMKPL